MTNEKPTCPAHLFGKPGEGVHRHRFLGIAIVDLAATAIVAVVLAKTFKRSFAAFFVGLLLLGVLLHWHFRVDTAVNKAIFGEQNNCENQ